MRYELQTPTTLPSKNYSDVYRKRVWLGPKIGLEAALERNSNYSKNPKTMFPTLIELFQLYLLQGLLDVLFPFLAEYFLLLLRLTSSTF